MDRRSRLEALSGFSGKPPVLRGLPFLLRNDYLVIAHHLIRLTSPRGQLFGQMFFFNRTSFVGELTGEHQEPLRNCKIEPFCSPSR